MSDCLVTLGLLTDVDRHSHGIVDALFALFTTLFFGTRTTPGLPDGIRSVPEWDEKLKYAYRNESFVCSITRKLGILAFDKFYNGWLHYDKIGTPNKDSIEARQLGGRRPEPHHFHFFLNTDGVASMRYMIHESEDRKHYLPETNKPPIRVIDLLV